MSRRLDYGSQAQCRLRVPARQLVRYFGSYSDEALAAVAKEIKRWRARGLDVCAYFDNDIKSAAPRDALRLKGLLGR